MVRIAERPNAAKRLSSIMSAQKRGADAPQYGKVSGRIDKRSLWKASTGNPRVFSRRGSQSPTRLRLVILLDMSGSMTDEVELGGEYYDDGLIQPAAQGVWDLICAARLQHTVKAEAWGHTTFDARSPFVGTDQQRQRLSTRGIGTAVLLKQLWGEGMSRQVLEQRINSTSHNGNEDGYALEAVIKDVEHRLDPNERMLVLVLSDGEPSYIDDPYKFDFDGKRIVPAHKHIRGIASAARKRGHAVISVAMSPELHKDAQEEMYGKGAVVQYTPNPVVLAGQLARIVGAALDGRIR